VRRFLSTSVFSSQSSAFASASASDANANDKRAVTPSTTLFVHGNTCATKNYNYD